MTSRKPFPTRFAIFFGEEYVFASSAKEVEVSTDVFCRRSLSNGLEVVATNAGLLAFEFAKTDLGEFELLQMKSAGVVPDTVMESTDAALRLQSKRLQLAVFVAACIMGRYAKLSNSSLYKPSYPGLHEVFDWNEAADGKSVLISQADYPRISGLLEKRIENLKNQKGSRWAISLNRFCEGIDCANRLLSVNDEFSVSDIPALIHMTLQAAILHGLQHAGASIALSAAVLESLIHELFFLAGFVRGVPGQPRLSASGLNEPLSKNRLKDMRAADRIEFCREQGLLDVYLAQRVDEVRDARNRLLHRGRDARSQESGAALTAIRDLIKICTGEELELNVPWSYRL